MTTGTHSKRPVRDSQRPPRPSILAMLEARSVALVGASPRPGSFGRRMVDEVTRSPARPAIYLVNPKYRQIGERSCRPSLADLPGPVDLVLLAVPDRCLEQQLSLAAQRGDASAVIFGNAHEDHPDPARDPARLATIQPAPDPGRPAPAEPAPAQPAPAQPAPAYRPPDPGRPAPAQPTLRDRLATIARSAGMALCGGGCMGFVNVARGLRAIGYIEPDPLPAGPVALVTHSGSVFSALLRSRRAIGFTLAVSSGQELVTAAASYLEYAVGLPETRVLALVLEAMRDSGQLRQVLAAAAERDIPAVLLTAGSSASGRMMVAAHSGALAAADGGWEALARAYGVHRVTDLAEMADTLEMFAIGRRARPRRRPGGIAAMPDPAPGHGIATVRSPAPGHGIATVRSPAPGHGIATVRSPAPGHGIATVRSPAPGHGIATVHDSGLERAHAADLAEPLGVPFAQISQATTARLADLLDPGLVPANPLDVWGTGADTRALFAGSLAALADDPAVDAVALAVDLVHELDGDRSYPEAMLEVARRTDKPLAVLSNLGRAVDPELADELRRAGIPVLEGMRTGLLALRHLLDHATPAKNASPAPPAKNASPAPPTENARPAASANSAWPAAASRRDRAAASRRDRAAASRRDRAAAILASGIASGAPLLDLLREYGIATVRAARAASASAALAAAQLTGYPVVLKTDEPPILHKSDAGGVIPGIRDPAELRAAYRGLAARLGPHVLICETAPPGTELALGIARDPDLGPLIVVGAGGILVELMADRAVALPPVDEQLASELLGELRVSRLLQGARGAPAADLPAVVRAITGLSALACELGDQLEALDVNPLICGPAGALAVDALAVRRLADA
jgi:acetate---CoA ligase (ADP-forming)